MKPKSKLKRLIAKKEKTLEALASDLLYLKVLLRLIEEGKR